MDIHGIAQLPMPQKITRKVHHVIHGRMLFYPTPLSINALSYTLEKVLNLLHAKDPRMVIVSMLTTPGQPPLTVIEEDAARIKQLQKG
jgi:hypothetical protein